MKKVNEVRIIDFPKIKDPRGNLTFLQYQDQVPYQIERVFWTYDVPGGETRGGHAYKTQHEIIIAISGSFDVVITHSNGDKEKFQLNRSYYGLFVPALSWRHMENFSTNALSLHLSSSKFNKEDYIRNFQELKEMMK